MSEDNTWLIAVIYKVTPYLSQFASKQFSTEINRFFSKSLLGRNKNFAKIEISPTIAPIPMDFLVHNNEEPNLIVDFDLKFEGGIQDEIKLILMEMTSGIKSISFDCRVRLSLEALTPALPPFKNVQITLLERPTIAFDLTGLANLGDIPFLSGKIRQEITEVIERRVVFPNKINIDPVTGRMELNGAMHLYEPKGVLSIIITNLDTKRSPGFWSWLTGKTEFRIYAQIGNFVEEAVVTKDDDALKWADNSMNIPLETLVGHNLEISVVHAGTFKNNVWGRHTIHYRNLQTKIMDRNIQISLEDPSNKEHVGAVMNLQLNWYRRSHENGSKRPDRSVWIIFVKECLNLGVNDPRCRTRILVRYKEMGTDKGAVTVKGERVGIGLTRPIYEEQFIVTDAADSPDLQIEIVNADSENEVFGILDINNDVEEHVTSFGSSKETAALIRLRVDRKFFYGR